MGDRLLDEYKQLQATVEVFDGKVLTIKAWSVTLSAAGIVAAYVEDVAPVLLIAAFSSIVFWLVEALWKVNQYSFYAEYMRLRTRSETAWIYRLFRLHRVGRCRGVRRRKRDLFLPYLDGLTSFCPMRL